MRREGKRKNKGVGREVGEGKGECVEERGKGGKMGWGGRLFEKCLKVDDSVGTSVMNIDMKETTIYL